MKRYWKYVKPYLPAFIIGPLLMIVEVVGEVILPKFMANIINVGAAQHNVPYIIGIGTAMVATAFLMMAGGIGGAYFAAKAAISFASDLRSDVFDKVQKFSFSNLDQFSTGSLVTRLTNDITQVQNVINMALRMMLRAPGMLIGALFMAFMMNAQLALVVLVVIPILVLLIALVIRTAFPRFDYMQKKLEFRRVLFRSHAHYDAFDECHHTGHRMVRRKTDSGWNHAGRGSDGIYHVYRADSDVPYDAGDGPFAELKGTGIYPSYHGGAGYTGESDG